MCAMYHMCVSVRGHRSVVATSPVCSAKLYRSPASSKHHPMASTSAKCAWPFQAEGFRACNPPCMMGGSSCRVCAERKVTMTCANGA